MLASIVAAQSEVVGVIAADDKAGIGIVVGVIAAEDEDGIGVVVGVVAAEDKGGIGVVVGGIGIVVVAVVDADAEIDRVVSRLGNGPNER